MLHKEYFNKIYNTRVALPHILFEKIVTCKSKKNHARKRDIKTKEGKCTKQCNHKYEICLWEMI